MAFSAPPPSREDAELGDWGVLGAVRMAFPDPAGEGDDAEYAARLDLYIRDMSREHGLEASAARDREQIGWSYSEMASALIERAVPGQEAVDLLVLAYAIPDINPGRNMAALLSSRCPGAPLAFGLTDQGAAGPFTGLRLIREYARTAGLRRALLLVVEQAALPYQAGGSVAMPSGHTGVAIVFGDEPQTHLGPIVTRVGTHADAIEEEIRALCSDPSEATVILGSALHSAAGRLAAGGFGQVRIGRPGRPLTGLWWEFADEHETADGVPRCTVLCDYDPLQGCVCLAVLGADSATGQSHVFDTTRNGSAPVSAIAAR